MNTQQYVKWFRSTSPYINAHRGRTFVLALGGEAIAHANFTNIAEDIALLNSLGVRLVLVHGATPQIDAQLASANLQCQFVDGLRVSSATTVDHIAAAIALVRVKIEARLSRSLLQPSSGGRTLKIAASNYVTAKPVGIVNGTDFEHTG
ncbi:MAG: amino-acid N-acetyltransferase, partial [Pseudomonadales bacterium]